ncbi:MAG: Ig-like domain-containing protein, partial [Treponema sp.]|nr:Ig-like domain-containing protein [Treponema sp.]
FVNNTGPEVQIAYPQQDAAVDGIFTVAGYARHPVGIKSVSWKLGKEGGELPLVTGNPWWVKEFDIRGRKLSSVDLEIQAVDLSGNVTSVKRRLKVDQNAGMPKITLDEPAALSVIEDGVLNVRGTASDNEAVASVFYSVDSGPPAEIPCSGYFQFAVPGLSPGTHVFEIWAKDVTDIEGPKVQVKGIVSAGPLPEPRLVSVKTGSGKTLAAADFYTGMAINPEPKMVLELAVRSAVPVSRASAAFAGRPEITVNVKAGKDGIYRADVPVPQDLSGGLAKIELRAAGRDGREALWEEYAYFGDQAAPAFQWVRPDESPGGGRILVSSAGEALMGLGGTPLQSAELTGEGAENFQASVDSDGRLLLKALGEGEFGPLGLDLSGRDGSRFSSAPFNILADFSAPSLDLPDAPDGAWARGEISVKYKASDANAIQSLDYSADLGGSWQPLAADEELASLNSGEVIEQTLDISSFQDGTLTILVRAVDGAKRQTVKSFLVRKDTKAPAPRLIVPVSEARVNGTVRLGIAVDEAGGLAKVSYVRPGTEDEAEDGASDGETPVPAIEKELPPQRFMDVLLDSVEMPLDENMRFVFEDEAGNRSELDAWPFVIDREMDIPVAYIILPLEDETITGDFVASGVMYDDDAVKRVYWHIDGGEEQALDAKNGFSIPVTFSGLTDNGHSLTVTAEDIYGVRGDPVTRNFRVSLSEPGASVTLPAFDTIVRETVQISGRAFDENGIEKVQVSLDNGNTFNDAVIAPGEKNSPAGEEDSETAGDEPGESEPAENSVEWSYRFNSKIVRDGTHVVFVQVFDKFGLSAIYSSLINIDNTAPEVTLDTPRDGTVTTGPVNVTGRAVDLNMDEITVELRSLGEEPVPEDMKTRRLEPAPLLMEQMDLSGLADGLYNIEIWAVDKAKNITRVSRNIELARESNRNFVDILYPLEGVHVQGAFNLYGCAGGTDRAQTVTLAINGRDYGTADVTEAGYYRFSLDGEQLETGLNRLTVYSSFGGAGETRSGERGIYYRPDGAWVTVDSLNMGDFAFERPWFSGRAGYALSAGDEAVLADKKAGRAEKAKILAKTPEFIDISFDNGNTFAVTGKGREKTYDWSYRLETGEMTEGTHYIIVRANMKNGETAITRTLVQVDKTPPQIRLISPQAGGRYNQDLEYTAMASDDVEMASLDYYLRAGDKLAYAIPGFVQGLYFETSLPPVIRQVANGAPSLFAGGATYMDIGFGLSFFGDNVKIQGQYGFMTQNIYEGLGGEGDLRYGGHVLGLKLLANVYTLPVGSLAGPDWEWLYASFALGANFSLFDVGRQGYTQSGSATWLSAILAQLEFPKVTIPRRSYLRTFSFFTEGQLWFLSTDVNAKSQDIRTVVPHVITGLRMYIF